MIRSKFFSELVPDVTTKAKELGPVYTGIFMVGRLLYQSPSKSWTDSSIVKRIMCSCGYEAASFDASFNEYHPICPKCGGALIHFTTERSSVNTFSASRYNMRINSAGHLEISELCATISPHVVKHTPFAPTVSLEKMVENIKQMELAITEKPLYTIIKDSMGHMKIKAHAHSSRNIKVPLCEETRDFLGENIITSMSNQNDEFEFSADFFLAAQDFPEIFTSENLKKNMDGVKDVVRLHHDTGTTAYDGSVIPSSASIEEFFEKKGFPVQLFPPNCYGRTNLCYDRGQYLKFLETEVGKIVTNRIANGIPFSCGGIDEIVYLATAKRMGCMPPPWRYHRYGCKLNDPVLDGYDDLFPSFFKDAVDNYTSDELSVLFAYRISKLRSMGLSAPTEETVRTRKFSSLYNEQKFISKKSVNISEDMSKSPLDTLCSLSKRPPETI